MKNKLLILSLLLLPTLCTQCQDDEVNMDSLKSVQTPVPHDPNLPLTVERVTPDSGGAATQLLFYGSNFGTDVSQINLTVGGKKAAVIRSTGSVLYALVPPQVRPDAGLCDLAIGVGEQSVTYDKQFHYTPKYLVGELVGAFVNENREGAVIDGEFEIARFNEPYWLAFDDKKNLYLIEENNGLRYIDLQNRKVTTKFRTGNGMARPRTIAFTPGYDTMYIVNDAGNWTDMGHAMLTSTDNFTSWTRIANSKQCNGGAFHPIDHDYYFNSYEASQVFKVVNRNNTEWKNGTDYVEQFRFGENAWEFNIQFAPSGDFAYLVSINRHYVGKATYNKQKRTLENAVAVFVGQRDKSGYADGSGSGALFNKPHQGAFDEYDNFYLCDAMNQCIRKITPDGVVTTFAGRPKEYGIVNGDLRTAQFDQPWGIVYDGDTKTFYVADQKNRRIRTISYQ
ncbi:MAG: IPT/TIG domain-containing protein [Prevotellaceae bacterium]|jgi:DNA-binding beta-propeller fold protein YncE|nr:IPT/TIG domain-containing protein [Prevotellaceae bacterium]